MGINAILITAGIVGEGGKAAPGVTVLATSRGASLIVSVLLREFISRSFRANSGKVK